MDHGSSGATALLGMDGFVVLASIEEAGELFRHFGSEQGLTSTIERAGASKI